MLERMGISSHGRVRQRSRYTRELSIGLCTTTTGYRPEPPRPPRQIAFILRAEKLSHGGLFGWDLEAIDERSKDCRWDQSWP